MKAVTTYSRRKRRVSKALMATTVAAAMMGGFSPKAASAEKVWDGGFGTWNTAGSWSPSGVPTTDDFVLIDTPTVVQLNGNTAPINQLEMRLGANLATAGSFLHVQMPNGHGTIQLQGAGTQLIVNPRQPIGVFNAVNTSDLNVSGGNVAMQGGVVQVRDRLNVTSGKITGHGIIAIDGTSSSSLHNANGTITASGGTLTIQNLNGGFFDLDGSTGNETFAVLNVIDGSSTLRLNAPLNDDFDGTANIRGGNLLLYSDRFVLGSNGVVNIDANGGSGGTGKLIADEFANHGTINVNSGIAQIGATNTPIALTRIGGGLVNIADQATLELRDQAHIQSSGEVHLSGGTMTGAAVINSGLISGHGSITSESINNNGTILAKRGTLTIDTVAPFADVDGGSGNGKLASANGLLELIFDGPGSANFRGDIDLQINGRLSSTNTLRVENGGSVSMTNLSRLIVPSYIQEQGSSLTVSGIVTSVIESGFFTSLNGTNAINGPLVLDGTFFVGQTATMQGDGTLFVEPDSRLAADHESQIGVNVFNQGRLTPGILNNGAMATVGFDSLTLASASTLEIDIAGTTPGTEFDQVTADSITAGGTLDIRLASGFTPQRGVDFQIIRADEITGQFEAYTGDVFAVSNDLALVPVLFDGDPVGDSDKLILVATAPGDANADGNVDVADLGILGANFGQADQDWYTGDFNADGIVDVADLGILGSNFQDNVTNLTFAEALQVSALSASVPEPGTITLLTISGLLLASRRRA